MLTLLMQIHKEDDYLASIWMDRNKEPRAEIDQKGKT